MSLARVLVADDDPNLLNVVAFVLKQEGFEVLTAKDGVEALLKAQESNPDVLVLDLMLPKRDGFEVCRALRRHSDLPILMLTARDGEGDKIRGLDLGADDYLTKPFSTRELVARVKALVRRSGFVAQHQPRVLSLGDLTIDLASCSVTVGQKEAKLTPTEFRLLRCLSAKPGTVLSCQDLVWQVHSYRCSEQEANELMKVAIRRLRRKIEPDPEQPRYVLNVRGFGYALSKPPPREDELSEVDGRASGWTAS